MHKTGLFKKTGSILLSLLLFACVFFTPAQALQTTMEKLQSESVSFYASDENRLVCSEPILREDFADVYKSRTRAVVTVSQEIKDLLRNAVLNTQTEVIVSQYSIPYSKEYAQLVANYLQNCVPEAFHVTNVRYFYYEGGNFYSFKFEYSCSAEEFATKTNEYKAVAQQLLQGIDDKLSDVEKALLLHDRLALHCEYGNVNASTAETSNVYAALVGRKPVCQGYAEAYLYLLGQVGIQSEIVSSDALKHAWNIVYIGGIPYHVDVTWDDPTDDIYGRVEHKNFLLSTNALKAGIGDSKPHNAEDFSTIPTSTKYDSYFWQDSEAAFQLVDDEIYYIDTVEQRIEKMSDHSAVVSVAGTWNINNSGTYHLIGNHAKLACVNDVLYCNMPTAVYSVDVKNKTMTKFYTPDMTVDGTKHYSIQGFAYENNTMYFDFARYNSGYILTAKASASVPAVCDHKNTEYKNGYASSCGASGKTDDLVCTNCGTILEAGIKIPVTGVHTWDNGTVILAPTTETTGTIRYICTECTAKKDVTLDKLPSGTTNTYGDVNSDGAITSGDARLVLRASVGLETFTDTEKELADIDGDGTLTAGDARLILRYSVGLTDEWPR